MRSQGHGEILPGVSVHSPPWTWGDTSSRVSSPSWTRSSRTSASTATSARRAASPSTAGPSSTSGAASPIARPSGRGRATRCSSSSRRPRARPRVCAHLLVAARPARRRRTGRALLARVRRERQGRHPGALGALPPGRPRRDRGRPSPSTRRSRGTRSWRRWPPSRRTGSRARRTATTCAPTAGSSASSCGASTGAPSAGSSPTRSPAPLGLDFWIGLPEAQEPRVSTAGAAGAGRPIPPPQALFEQFAGPDTILGRTLTGPSGLFHYDEMWNTRAIARGRAAVVERHRRRAVGRPDVRGDRRRRSTASGCSSPRPSRPPTVEQAKGPDQVVMFPMRYGLGFMLAADARRQCRHARVRARRRGRVARLRRPRPRARVRLRDEPDGDGHERRRARLEPRRRRVRLPRLTGDRVTFAFRRESNCRRRRAFR